MTENTNALIRSCNANNTDGIIFGKDSQDNVRVYQNPNSDGVNIFDIGIACSGNSFSFIAPNLLQAGKRGESVVILDERGEHLDFTRSYFEKLGYYVKVFNNSSFLPLKSDEWNVMKMLDQGDVANNAIDFASIIISSENEINEVQDFRSNKFQTQSSLLAAILLYVRLNDDINDKFKSALDIINHPDGVAYLNKIFAEKKTPDKCRELYQMFFNLDQNLQDNYLQSLVTIMSKYDNEELLAIVDGDDCVDFDKLMEKPCIYYIVPDTRTYWHPFETFFLHLAFTRIQARYMKATSDESLIRVNVFVDSVMSCGTIPNLDTAILACSKCGTNTILTAHCIETIQLKYHNWDAILNNCNVILGMGFCDLETAEAFVERINEMSGDMSFKAAKFKEIIKKIKGDNNLKMPTPDDLLAMDYRECVVVLADGTGYLCKKYPVSEHPNAKRIMSERKGH